MLSSLLGFDCTLTVTTPPAVAWADGEMVGQRGLCPPLPTAPGRSCVREGLQRGVSPAFNISTRKEREVRDGHLWVPCPWAVTSQFATRAKEAQLISRVVDV